jgi:tryptophan-rich sensory protein
MGMEMTDWLPIIVVTIALLVSLFLLSLAREPRLSWVLPNKIFGFIWIILAFLTAVSWLSLRQDAKRKSLLGLINTLFVTGIVTAVLSLAYEILLREYIGSLIMLFISFVAVSQLIEISFEIGDVPAALISGFRLLWFTYMITITSYHI